MPSPSLSLLFLPSFLLSISSSPLQSQPISFPPTTLSQPANLTHPGPLFSDLACVRKRRFWSPCPNYYDCLYAIFQLPDLDGDGSFHNGPPNDPFRLPVAKTHGTCRVRVELRHEGSSRQASSWPFIVHRALTLATMWVICSFSYRIFFCPLILLGLYLLWVGRYQKEEECFALDPLPS